MKFIVSRNILLQALLHTRCYMASNVWLFKNTFQITVSDRHLTVTSTDGLIFKTEQIDLEKEIKDDPRTFYLNSTMLVKAIKSLGDQPLEFLVEEYQLTVHHSDGYFRLPLYDNQYPEPKAMTDENVMHLHLEAPGLRSQLSKVVYAAADDELRPVMCGVLMEIENNNITYVATNGHLLVRLIKKCQEDNSFISSFILPSYAVNALLKILPPTGYCELYFQNPVGDIKRPILKVVINDTLTIQFECIDGRYPNYKAVIPTEFTQSFQVDRRQLTKMLDRISLFAPTSRRVKIKITPDSKVLLESRDIDENYMSSESIQCSLNGEFSKTCARVDVNVHLLIKILRNLCGEQVQFNLTTQNHAFTICPVPQPDVEEITALLMPIMSDDDD